MTFTLHPRYNTLRSSLLHAHPRYNALRCNAWMVIFLILIPLFSSLLLAQEKLSPTLWYGLHGGASFNTHVGNFPGFEGTARCGTFTGGQGTGFFLGHFLEWHVSKILVLTPRMTFSTLDGSLKAPDGFIATLPPDYSTPTQITTEHTLTTNFSYLAFEGLVRVSLHSFPLALYGGIGAGVVFNRTFDQQEIIISPPNVGFTDLKNASGAIPNSSSFRATLIAGASYDFYLSGEVVLAPEVMYHFPLTKVITDIDWRISSLHLGVQFKFGISREPEKKIEPPAIIQPPPPPLLAAAISVKSIYPDGSMKDVVNITIEETEATDMFPLLPYIFFGEGKSSLPPSQTQLLKGQVVQFDEANLQRETLSMYREVLNIIGKRAQRFPYAKLTLTGFTGSTQTELSDQHLAIARAEAAKKYFTDVWNIAPDRINVTQGSADIIPNSPEINLLEEEARRVVISSDTYEILAPIFLTDIERTVTPPKVIFTPEVNSQVGLTDWTIHVQQNEKLLTSFHGRHEIASGYDWNIDKTILPLSDSPIRVSLTVHDHASQERAASASIPVNNLTIKKKRGERIGNMKIDRYRLILFEYNSAAIGPVNQRIIDFIRDRLAPNSKITVDGYTDHIGLEENNTLLSSERAQNVRAGLGNTIGDDRILIRANGESDLFGNASAEGRYFCRTVYVTVETPSE